MAFAAITGGFLLVTRADTTSATDTNTTTTTVNDNDLQFWSNVTMGFGGPGFGRGFGRGCGGGFGAGPGGWGSVEISAEYEEKVTNIAKSDSDVQQLLDEGYNITRVIPIIKTIVDGEGNVVTKATNATVILEKDTTGRAFVSVDLEQEKVTKIVILTRTVIEK